MMLGKLALIICLFGLIQYAELSKFSDNPCYKPSKEKSKGLKYEIDFLDFF